MILKTVKATALVLVLATGMSGCANIKDDQTRTKTEGTLLGAGLGAAIGTGIAAVATRGNRDAMLAGAAIGGAIGGMAGHAYGSKVAAQKTQYASNEAYLQACLSELQHESQRVALSNAKARKSIALQKQELNQLIALRNNNEPTREKFVALNRSVESSLKTATNDLNRTDALIQDHEAALASSGGDRTAWKRELAGLKAERAALVASIDNLNAMENTTSTLIAQAR